MGNTSGKEYLHKPQPRFKSESVMFDHKMILEGELQSFGESFDDSYIIIQDGNQSHQDYLVDTEHCINPGCDCTEVRIGFRRLDLTTSKASDIDLIVRYNIETDQWYLEKKNKNIDEHFLIGCLKELIKSNNQTLQTICAQRHKYFKKTYEQCVLNDMSISQGFTDDVFELNNQTRYKSTTEMRSSQKIGRNDPCPCNSGKKYKKCCAIKNSHTGILAHPEESPVYRSAYTKEAFDDAGIGTVVVIRKHSSGKYIFANYLCDIYCLGVKDTYIKILSTEAELSHMLRMYTFNMKLYDLPYETCRSLVLGSVDFSTGYGLQAHGDFDQTSKSLEPNKSYDASLRTDFGVIYKQGILGNKKRIPHYQPGPYDKREKIVQTLENKGLVKGKDFLYTEGPMMGTSAFL